MMTLKEIMETDNVMLDDWLYHHVDYLDELGFEQEPLYMYIDDETESKKNVSSTSTDPDEFIKYPNIKIYLKRGDGEKYFLLEYKDNYTGQETSHEFRGDKTIHSDFGFDEMIGFIQKIIEKL